MPDVERLLENQPIMLFDGSCRFCNRFFRFVAYRDGGELHYAPLQSEPGEALLDHFGIDEDSFVFIESGDAFTESEAVYRLLSHLGGFWKFLGYLIAFFPGVIRDQCYRSLARNRKKVFGTQESCDVPDQSVRNRFLDRDQ